MIIWLTGNPSSGKTSIAYVLQERLKMQKFSVEVLDGDNIRILMGNDLTWSRKDRRVQIERVGWLANILSSNNIITICALVSPYISDRDFIRKNSKEFLEVYVSCPESICIERDIKGLYKNNKIDLTIYEPPINPEVILHTDRQTITECVDKILEVMFC